MKRKLLIIGGSLLLSVFDLVTRAFDLPVSIADWICYHLYLLLVVILTGVVLVFFRSSRRLSYVFLSSGAVAVVAGVATYLLYPVFDSTTARPADFAAVLGSVFGQFIFAADAITAGLIVGWLFASRHIRLHKVA